MNHAKKTLLLLAITLAFSLASRADDDHYDEMFDFDGSVRPHYAEVNEIYSSLSKKKKEKLKKESVAQFDGDNALLPLPRLIPRDEYETLKKGIEQRATALRMFLQDYYSGKKRYQKAGIVPADVIKRAIKRAGEEAWMGAVNPDTIAFWYGPDIVRDSKGNFRVVEDNANFIGGPGDLVRAREILFNQVPEYESAIAAPDPIEFYKRLVARYKARAVPPGAPLVLVQYSPQYAADEEDGRLAKLFEDLGVEVVHINRMKTVDKRLKKRLVVRQDGVYLEKTTKRGNKIRRRVGFVLSHVEPSELDATYPAARRQKITSAWRNVLENDEVPQEIRDQVQEHWNDTEALDQLGNQYFDSERWAGGDGIPGLFQAQFDGKVALNTAPGTEFTNDKEFYMYVDDLVRFYLKEEPLVTNIPTKSFGKDSRLLNKVFDNLDNFVIKRVDGRGGSAVWVGPKIEKKFVKTLRKMIEAEPDAFIAQRYTPLSVLDNHIVDLRLISDVAPNSVFVTDTPWGRAAPVGGDGKVNISQRGSETAVFVVDPPGRCTNARRAEKLLLEAEIQF